MVQSCTCTAGLVTGGPDPDPSPNTRNPNSAKYPYTSPGRLRVPLSRVVRRAPQTGRTRCERTGWPSRGTLESNTSCCPPPLSCRAENAARVAPQKGIERVVAGARLLAAHLVGNLSASMASSSSSSWTIAASQKLRISASTKALSAGSLSSSRSCQKKGGCGDVGERESDMACRECRCGETVPRDGADV